MQKPLISVIIPALNEEGYIGKVLDSLLRHGSKGVEVIVVDNGSKDRTRAIVRKYKNVRLALEPMKGTSRARNMGARLAKADLLFFLDADTTVSKGLFSIYIDAFRKDRSLAAATGPIQPLEKTSRKVAFSYFMVSRVFVPLLIAIRRPLIIGHNFCVRKKFFTMLGGFNKDYVTYEDWDLSTKLQRLGRLRYIKSALVYTSVRRTEKWGIIRYLFFTLGNMLRYGMFRKPKADYEPIR
ncbi:MAG: glycosyltransferase [Candidatus Marsarchaeota archaeon]|nr:glycosyltransferase [Candidatus Marsarchaeota archaeon]MCL5106010.1 glycosyltransferase [Candidatus Marsarchaeota archaeon]